MTILSIGNSFSEDATEYLSDMAKCSDIDLLTANLFFPGCSLERHFRHYLADQRAYQLQFNGTMSGFYLSIKEALLSRAWDIVTIQQVSSQSCRFETYTPYLEYLCNEIRTLCPKAKLIIHKVWMYEAGSKQLATLTPYETPDEMYEALSVAYEKAAQTVKADGMIPSGDIMYRLSKSGVGAIHRDGFHASHGLGRYAIAMTWLRYLTGVDVSDNDFNPRKHPLTEEQIAMVKALVSELSPLSL